jgi:hypothetical protein
LPLPRRNPDRSGPASVKKVERDPVATDPVVLGKVLDGLKRLEPDPAPGPEEPSEPKPRRRRRQPTRPAR